VVPSAKRQYEARLANQPCCCLSGIRAAVVESSALSHSHGKGRCPPSASMYHFSVPVWYSEYLFWWVIRQAARTLFNMDIDASMIVAHWGSQRPISANSGPNVLVSSLGRARPWAFSQAVLRAEDAFPAEVEC
jgi:hypothetical protein